MVVTEEHVQQALALAVALAKDGKVQQRIGERVNEMKAAGFSNRGVVKALLITTYDGLTWAD